MFWRSVVASTGYGPILAMRKVAGSIPGVGYDQVEISRLATSSRRTPHPRLDFPDHVYALPGLLPRHVFCLAHSSIPLRMCATGEHEYMYSNRQNNTVLEHLLFWCGVVVLPVTSVVHWWYFDGTSVVQRWYIGGTSVVNQWYIGDTSMVHWWCIGGTSVVHRWYINDT